MTRTSPQHTFALIVGIDVYHPNLGGPNLVGPAYDACAFAHWLVKRGVPESHIWLHLAPIDEVQPPAAVHVRQATREQIRTTITQLVAQAHGDTLFIFWGGHGIINDEWKRQLVYADATEQDLQTADLDSLLNYLRSRHVQNFFQQFCIFDVCGNYFAKSTLSPDPYPRGQPVTEREQLALFASKLGELAGNSTERKTGLFSEELLKQLGQLPEGIWPPAMDTVLEQVIKTFNKLRNESDFDRVQTPTYSWYQDSLGNNRLNGHVVDVLTQPVSYNPAVIEVREFFEAQGILFTDDESPPNLLRNLFPTHAEITPLEKLGDKRIPVQLLDTSRSIRKSEIILSGNNMIIIAPSGYGKTYQLRFAQIHFQKTQGLPVNFNFASDMPIDLDRKDKSLISQFYHAVISHIVRRIDDYISKSGLAGVISTDDSKFLRMMKDDQRKTLKRLSFGIGTCFTKLELIARSIGCRQIYILFDDFGKFAQDKELEARIIFRDFFRPTIVSRERSTFLFFTSDMIGQRRTEDWLKDIQNSWNQAFSVYYLGAWDRKVLFQMLDIYLLENRRSQEGITQLGGSERFEDLFDDQARAIIEAKIGDVVKGSPRNILQLAYRIIEKHCARITDPRTRISEETLDLAIKAFLSD